MKQIQVDQIQLKIFDTRLEMGQTAADEAAICIQKLLETNEEINCIFAAAPSQNEFLAALVAHTDIEWNRINAYHMDEYVGFGIGHPNSFNHFLSKAIFDHVPFKSVNKFNGSNDADEEANRYADLLKKAPTHITFLGIGENGHIAFNDPDFADFNDPLDVKKVELDDICRMQQVHDGCFPTLEDVPKYALTVTIPRLMESQHLFCIVPSEKKHDAVMRTLTGEITEVCPASIMRRTPNTNMYIDAACAGSFGEE